MSRRSHDPLSQRAVAVRLRTAIDRASVDGRAWRTVERLVRTNPRASVSSHVTHNLGDRRVALARARSPLFASLLVGPPANSLVPLRRDAGASLAPESQNVRRENFPDDPDS